MSMSIVNLSSSYASHKTLESIIGFKGGLIAYVFFCQECWRLTTSLASKFESELSKLGENDTKKNLSKIDFLDRFFKPNFEWHNYKPIDKFTMIATTLQKEPENEVFRPRKCVSKMAI